jgi:hypothetical protein
MRDYTPALVQCLLDTSFAKLFIAGRDDSTVFDHKNYRALRRSRAVEHSLGNDNALPGREFNGAAFQVDDQLAFDHIKKLVVVIVFVPVVFALNHTNADN